MHRTKIKIAEDALDANTTIATANRVDFDRAGVAVVNLMSAPGAGKTSLLKLLYLAQRPSRGLIRLFGEDAVTMPRERLPALRRRIGGLTVEDILSARDEGRR